MLAPASAQPAGADEYALHANWLCRPGRADACATPLRVAQAQADGSLTQLPTVAPAADALIDCFYVYPTVSHQPTPNADRHIDPEQIAVVRSQFARFGSQCRLYAPLYRQVTLAGLHAALRGHKGGIDYSAPYDDVLAAWRHYLAHDNHGRGVVLVGHSQGAKLLVRLMAREIDGQPVARQLVVAIVPGTAVLVPNGQDVGATFSQLPLCRGAAQTGCVIAYSSYDSNLTDQPDATNVPQAANARYGRSQHAGWEDACVPPQGEGPGDLAAALPPFKGIGAISGEGPAPDLVQVRGVLDGQCVRRDGQHYLAISAKAGAAQAAPVVQRLAAVQQRRPDWGLHELDLNLALDTLVERVGQQSTQWRTQQLGKP